MRHWTICCALMALVPSGLSSAGETPAAQPDTPRPPAPAAVEVGVNVRNFGAKGDWKTDDTAAIQRALDAAGYQDKPKALSAPATLVIIPPGHYRITAPLKLTSRHSHLEIRGVGAVDSFGTHPALPPGKQRAPYGNTELLWDGEEGGTLMELRNVSPLLMERIALNGGNKAGALIQIESPKKGGSSGRLTFRNLSFSRTKVAVECGRTTYNNSADMTFYDCNFSYCQTGLLTQSAQNMDYVFIRPHAVMCGTLFHLAKGGNLTVIGAALMYTDLCLRVDHPGINAGNYHFTNLHMETGGAKTYRVAHVRGECIVVFSSLSLQTQRKARATGDKRPLFELSDGAQVVITGGLIGNGPVAKLRSREKRPPSWLQFNNCRFRGPSGTDTPDPRNPKQLDCDDFSGFEMRSCLVGNQFVHTYTRLPKRAVKE